MISLIAQQQAHTSFRTSQPLALSSWFCHILWFTSPSSGDSPGFALRCLGLPVVELVEWARKLRVLALLMRGVCSGSDSSRGVCSLLRETLGYSFSSEHIPLSCYQNMLAYRKRPKWRRFYTKKNHFRTSHPSSLAVIPCRLVAQI